jgi:hypothetical protein
MQQATLAGDLFEYQPCLLVDRGSEKIGRVFVLLTGSAKAIANARGFDDGQLSDALMRYGLGRLKAELTTTGGEERLFQGVNASLEWKIDSGELIDLVGGDSLVKRCAYQLSLGRDLLCTAASIDDETVTAEIGYRRAATDLTPDLRRLSFAGLAFSLLEAHPPSGRRQGLRTDRPKTDCANGIL